MVPTDNTPTTIKVWHNSPIRITSLLDRPIWFSLTQHDGLGYWYAREEDSGESHLYSAEVTGRFVDILDVEGSLQKAGYDVDATIADIASNPDEDEVMEIPAVAHLASLGWDGIIYPDYNQWDTQEDTDALLVFSPKGKIRSLSEVVDAKGKARQAAEANGYDWSLDERVPLRHLREWREFNEQDDMEDLRGLMKDMQELTLAPTDEESRMDGFIKDFGEGLEPVAFAEYLDDYYHNPDEYDIDENSQYYSTICEYYEEISSHKSQFPIMVSGYGSTFWRGGALKNSPLYRLYVRRSK